MDYLALVSTDLEERILVISLTEDELQPARITDPAAFLYIPLGGEDFFGELYGFQHEHIILATAPLHMTLKDVDNIVDKVLKLDRNSETVRVLPLIPEVIKVMRNNPSDGYTFNLAPPLPTLVVLLGGIKALEEWKKQNIEEGDIGEQSN